MQYFRRIKHNILLCLSGQLIGRTLHMGVPLTSTKRVHVDSYSKANILISRRCLRLVCGSSASTNWAGSFKEPLESLDIDWILTCDHSGVLLVEPNILCATKYLIQMHRMSQGLNICLAFRSRWRISITSHCERLSAKLWMPFLRDWK